MYKFLRGNLLSRTHFIIFTSFFTYLLISIPPELLKDRLAYYDYFYYTSDWIDSNLNLNFLIFFKEPAFRYINLILNNFFNNPITAYNFLIGVSFILFSISIYKLSNKSRFFMYFIVFNPFIMQNYFLHLRQGLALSVALIIISFFVKKEDEIYDYYKIAIFAFFFCGFIHVVSFLISLSIIILYILHNIYPKQLLITISIFIITILILSIFYFVNFIPTRFSENLSVELFKNGIGLGFIFWSLIFFYLLMFGDQNGKGWDKSAILLILYLVLYIFTTYSGRYFDTAIVYFFLLMPIFREFFKLPTLTILFYNLASWYVLIRSGLWFNSNYFN